MVRLEDITRGFANATAITARGIGRAAVATGNYAWDHGGKKAYDKVAEEAKYVSTHKAETLGKTIDIAAKAVLSPWYLTGTAMFRRIEDKVYQPTTWFLGTPGPVQKQGTVWNLPWLFKPIVDETKPNKGVTKVKYKTIMGKERTKTVKEYVEISGEINSVDFTLPFVTQDGFEGEFKTAQFRHIIPNEKAAKTFYWDAGGDVNRVKEDVLGIASAKLSGTGLVNLMAGITPISNQMVVDVNSAGNPAEDFNDNLGVKIEKVALGSPTLSDKAQEFLSIPVVARQEAIAIGTIAAAREAAADLQLKGTKKRTRGYLSLGKKYYQAGSDFGAGDLGMELGALDGDQTRAGNQHLRYADSHTPMTIGSGRRRILPVEDEPAAA